MAKLNQIIAIEKGVKSKAYAAVTELHKFIQKPALFNGFQKDYQPVEEGGESLPSERHRVQLTVSDVLRRTEAEMVEMIDVTARKDFTNCVSKATVEVDGKVIIKDAPVSFLLFIEKQMNDMRAFANALPTLDENEDWSHDQNSGLMKSAVIKTHRTKKTQKPIVLYDATPEHPAQTQLITEDVIAGYWSQVKHSGAMARPDKEALVARIDALQKAVKQAREAANMVDEIPTGEIGRQIFDYLFK